MRNATPLLPFKTRRPTRRNYFLRVNFRPFSFFTRTTRAKINPEYNKVHLNKLQRWVAATCDGQTIQHTWRSRQKSHTIIHGGAQEFAVGFQLDFSEIPQHYISDVTTGFYVIFSQLLLHYHNSLPSPFYLYIRTWNFDLHPVAYVIRHM